MNNLKQFSIKLMALQKKIDSDKELIEAYSKEINLSEPMTLQELIGSHRHLRGVNRAYCEQWNEEINARVSDIISTKYVRWSELGKMTLADIVEFIG